jgi:predicted GIY-YIG superfamily endonuclease
MKTFHVYFIPYKDSGGDKLYCGYTNNLERRSNEHDKKRFSHPCETCKGGLITWLDAWYPSSSCPSCKGKKWVLNTITGRVKTGEIQSIFSCSTRSGAMKLEKYLKKQSSKFKHDIYHDSLINLTGPWRTR